MLKFKYKVSGSNKEGIIFAESKKQAFNLLVRQGIQASILTQVGADKSKDQTKRVKKLDSKIALPFLKRLLQLHGAGLPIGDTLKILQTRLQDENLKELAIVLWRELSEGKSLGSAMKNYPNIFGDDIIYPIEAAEATGNLAPVLQDIIRLLTEREELKKKVISGMSYPIIVSIIAIGVVIFFLFFLLPRIESMLTAMGGGLTLPAKILVGFSHFLLFGMPIFLVLAIGGWSALQWWRKHSEVGLLKTDTFCLKIPIIGNLVQLVEIILKKYIPGLYNSLGVYLPLITTNCAILGVALLNVESGYNFVESIIGSLGAGVGFMLAMVIFTGVRSRVDQAKPPKCFEGLPLTLVAAALVALSFTGFGGIVESIFGAI